MIVRTMSMLRKGLERVVVVVVVVVMGEPCCAVSTRINDGVK